LRRATPQPRSLEIELVAPHLDGLADPQTVSVDHEQKGVVPNACTNCKELHGEFDQNAPTWNGEVEWERRPIAGLFSRVAFSSSCSMVATAVVCRLVGYRRLEERGSGAGTSAPLCGGRGCL
jgi:hypothetical protein